MKLPVPQRGQPLDLSFIYDLVNSVNELWTQIATRVSTYASIDTASGRKSVRSSEIKFVAGYKEVLSSETSVSAGSTVAFQYDFTNEFMYPPIVTLTPITIGSSNTEASKNTSVVVTSVSTSRVEGIVKFDVTGKAAVGVNIVAVGVPV